MQIDIVEQLSIVAREATHEFHVVTMGLCLLALAGFAVYLALEKFGPILHKVYLDFLHLDGFGRIAAAAFLVVATMYGGAKHTKVDNAGADAGILLDGVYTEYDSTNDVTSVEVRYFTGNITTATQVSVRMTETNEWTTVTKIDPVITPGTTNILAFSVAGNTATNNYWWVGDDRPAIIFESSGIIITAFYASSSCVCVEFTCDDALAMEFALQTRVLGGSWVTVMTTPRAASMAFAYQGFTIDKTRKWRVTSSYSLGD